MRTSRRRRLIFILMTVAVLFVASSTMVMAKTAVRKTVYQGGGKVAVYFEDSVKYDGLEVIAKDGDDKVYKTEVLDKTSYKVQFDIEKYKTDRTYKITIKGLDSGNATTTFKILPKADAIKIAKEESNASGFKKVDCESGTYHYYGIWRVTFKGESSGKEWNYTYLIRQQDGRVMASSKKQD